jgi:hypothetical protein
MGATNENIIIIFKVGLGIWRGGFPPNVCREVWNSGSSSTNDEVRAQFQSIELFPPKNESPIWKVVYDLILAEAILSKNHSRYYSGSHT